MYIDLDSMLPGDWPGQINVAAYCVSVPCPCKKVSQGCRVWELGLHEQLLLHIAFMASSVDCMLHHLYVYM
jgi:hypothetical protein